MRTALGVVVVVGLLAGCGGERRREAAPTKETTQAAPVAPPATPPAPEATPAPATPVTAPQIVAIVTAANDADIAAGKVASEKATNDQVKTFAKRMVTDHGASNQQVSALATQLRITPEPNPGSQQIRETADRSLASLRTLSGAEFDRAYIANEVAFHQAVLDALTKTLIPSARNAELKALLAQTRVVVDSHLNLAKQIQGTLTSD
jgi:putative membrane protein